MNIKGWIRTSLIDYPEHFATVLFTGGCNFRCPMCHNADLVLSPAALPDIPQAEIWDFLARRVGLLDGVVITGGEPTLQNDLLDFLSQVRERGFDIKLDTNGYCPDVLAALLDARLVNYVAMDVKAPPRKYAQLAGVDELEIDRIARSIKLLRESDVKSEFRTTVVPELLFADDIAGIARWLDGAETYVLQQFRPQNTLNPDLATKTPYPPERFREMENRAARWVKKVQLRGIDL